MNDERKLFSGGDEFDFKRTFVTTFLAQMMLKQYEYYAHSHSPIETTIAFDAERMAGKAWDHVVEVLGVNDQPRIEKAGDETAT